MGYDKPTDDLLHLNTWLNAETNYHKQDADGMLPGFKTNGWGGTVGVHLNQNDGSAMGLALTAMYNDIETDSPDRLKGDMDSLYLSALVQLNSGAWRHTFVGSVGSSTVDTKRTVDYGTGSYTANGSTNGLSFGMLYEVGYAVPMSNEGTTILQPIFNIAWRYSQLDAYTETGTNAALRVAEQTHNSVILGAGARVQSVVGADTWNHAGILEARALAKANLGDRRGEADVALAAAGLQNATVKSSSLSVLSVELGVGVTIPLAVGNDIFVDFSADISSNHTNLNATVGYKVAF